MIAAYERKGVYVCVCGGGRGEQETTKCVVVKEEGVLFGWCRGQRNVPVMDSDTQGCISSGWALLRVRY